MTAKRTSWVWGAAAVATACGGAGGDAVPIASAPTSPPPVTAPISSSAVAATSASAAPGEAPVAPVAAQPSPFHLLATADVELDLVPVGDTLLVTGGPVFAQVKDGKIVRDESLGKGLPVLFGIGEVVGRWPDDVWMATTLTDGRTGWGAFFRREKGAWTQSGGRLNNSWLYAGLSEWSDGRILALAFSSMPWDPRDRAPRFVLARGKKTKLPLLTAGTGDCPTALTPLALRATADGHVFVAGQQCGGNFAGVEWFAPGQQHGKLETLGKAADSAFFAGNAADTYLVMEGTFAHFSGSEWKEQASPVSLMLALSVAVDGTLWALDGSKTGGVWTRAPGGDWKQVPAPVDEASGKTVRPFDVWAAPDGTVWLSAGTSLYWTKPAPAQVQKVTWEYGEQFAGTLRTPKAATESCQTPYVLLYAVTRTTPKDYDFPLTRKALKGHTELAGTVLAETEENGRRFFGAVPKDFAAGRKIVELVEASVKGSKPTLLCAEPRIVREVKWDIHTGELVK